MFLYSNNIILNSTKNVKVATIYTSLSALADLLGVFFGMAFIKIIYGK